MDSNKVCAVVVTYNIGKKYIENFNSLYDQVGKVIIVDNGSGEETVEVLQDLQKKYKNVEVIFNNENLGIGAAQNIGIKKAMRENFKWVLLLDHDSKLSSNMVGKLLTAYDVLFKQGINKVGIVAANPYDINSNEWIYIKMKYLKLEKDLIKFDNVISSGSLINLEVFKDVGLFN
jgi:rhamnosyltransferase